MTFEQGVQRGICIEGRSVIGFQQIKLFEVVWIFLQFFEKLTYFTNDSLFTTEAKKRDYYYLYSLSYINIC